MQARSALRATPGLEEWVVRTTVVMTLAWNQLHTFARLKTRARGVKAGLAWFAGVTRGLGLEDCRQLVLAALERGNVDLVVSIYRAVSSPVLASCDSGGSGSGGMWPAADLSIVTSIVLGLAR